MLTQLIEAYIDAMFFTDFHCDNEELEHLTVEDFSAELHGQIRDDCKKFFQQVEDLATERSVTQLGHDFWLTRNGHGAGFWDGDWPENGEALTDISNSFGEVNLYLGDDRKVYGA